MVFVKNQTRTMPVAFLEAPRLSDSKAVQFPSHVQRLKDASPKREKLHDPQRAIHLPSPVTCPRPRVHDQSPCPRRRDRSHLPDRGAFAIPGSHRQRDPNRHAQSDRAGCMGQSGQRRCKHGRRSPGPVGEWRSGRGFQD